MGKVQADLREGYSTKTPLDTAIDQSEKTTSLTKKSPGNKKINLTNNPHSIPMTTLLQRHYEVTNFNYKTSDKNNKDNCAISHGLARGKVSHENRAWLIRPINSTDSQKQ